MDHTTLEKLKLNDLFKMWVFWGFFGHKQKTIVSGSPILHYEQLWLKE